MHARFLNLLAVVVVTAGCASIGKDFSMADVDAMQPGVTTFQQAQEKLGKPHSVNTAADGRMAAMWIRSEAVMGSASAKGVGIIFDKDGKMIRVSSRTETKTN